MENYFEAKAKLFTGLAGQKTKDQTGGDCEHRRPLRRNSCSTGWIKAWPLSPTGWASRADFRASNYRAEFAGTSYQLDARGRAISCAFR